MKDRITEKEMLAEDVLSDQNLRPKSLKDYIGQKDVIDNLEVFIKAAKKRSESLDHVLFFGPAGLGKTTEVFFFIDFNNMIKGLFKDMIWITNNSIWI